MKELLDADAAHIKAGLRQAEGALDEALIETTTLMQAMLRARRHPDVPPHAGQRSILRLTEAMRQQVQAASNVFRVHDEMSEMGVAYGVLERHGATPASGLTDTVPVPAPRREEAA